MPPRQPAHDDLDFANIGLSFEDEAGLRWLWRGRPNNATRELAIRTRLRMLWPQHVDVLRAAYGHDLEPALLVRYGALSTGRTLPAALVLLMARRRRTPKRDLERWLTPPTPPPCPDTTGKTPAEVRKIRAAYRSTVFDFLQPWRLEADRALRPVRLAAVNALEMARAAYKATGQAVPGPGDDD